VGHLFTLIRPGILSVKNSISGKAALRRLPFISIGLVFWVLLYIGTYEGLFYIRRIDFFGELLSRKFFHMLFFSITGFLLLSNVITAITSFYLSNDIQFLSTLPLKAKDMLRVKTLGTILNSTWMVASFVPPILIAYGVSYGASMSYYIGVLTVFFLLTLISAGAGITLAHILTRLFPARGARDFFLLMGLLSFVFIYFLLRSSAPADFGNPVELLNRAMAFRPESPFLPSYWAVEAVSPMAGLNIFYLYVLAANGFFFLMVSEEAGIRLFGRNLEGIASKASNVKPAAGFYYPGYGRAVLYKDLKIFLRDRGQWSQLLIIAALGVIYIFNFRAIPLRTISDFTPFAKELMVLANLLMAGLVLVAVSARFTYTSVSLEGQAFWAIRSSPMSMERLLWTKFLYSTAVVALLVSGLVFVTNLNLDAGALLMLVSMAVILILCIGLGGMAAGLGALYPKFRYENIASVSMSLGGMSFMLVAFGVVVASLGLVSWPFYLVERAGGIAGLSLIEAVEAAACIALLFAVNFISFYLPFRLGVRNLKRLEE
jgi:ABC-2 type transport system permease protein